MEFEKTVRIIHFRLGEMKELVDQNKKGVTKEKQESIIRINSYQNIPPVDKKNLQVSLGNIMRYIVKHS